METISSPELINLVNLINLSKDIAQVNLGYLTISVGILGVLGGVFVYFNFKPLKETLDKQESAINELKKEAQGLLSLSAEQSEGILEDFKKSQSETLEAAFSQQTENLSLEITNSIQQVDKELSERIEQVSEDKDIKLREIILSETTNRLSILEKELIQQISVVKENINKVKSSLIGLRAKNEDLEEKIMELQVYKFSKEGKMGAIIYSIKLLQKAIDKYLYDKKSMGEGFVAKDFGWMVEVRLKELLEEIGNTVLDDNYILEISNLLIKIEAEKVFDDTIAKLKQVLVSSKKGLKTSA